MLDTLVVATDGGGNATVTSGIGAAVGSNSANIEAAFSESLYALSASTVGLLGTLASHGALMDSSGKGIDQNMWSSSSRTSASPSPYAGGGSAGRGGMRRSGAGAGDTGGARWVKEIAVGVAGSGGGWGGGGGGGGGGRDMDVLEACWAVARDVDGVHGELV